ncbi:MAG: hypothetical protein J6X88_11910 [Bacteroidales bacterium]|nr:hypothetical protein [Bacteroidales bacterium]
MRRSLAILVIVLLLSMGVAAQTDNTAPLGVDPTAELSVSDIVHMSDATFTDIIEFMIQKGYRAIGKTGTTTKMVNHIKMEYTCDTFASDDFRWHLLVFRSRNQLGNIIEFNAPLSAELRWLRLLDDNLYGSIQYNPTHKIFKGKEHGMDYQFIIHSDNATQIVTICAQNQEAIDTFVDRQTRIMEGIVAEQVTLAQQEENSKQYLQALIRMKAAESIFEPKRSEIVQIAKGVKERALPYYFTLLQQTVNLDNDNELGIRYCDTIEIISPGNDSVRQIKTYLTKVISGQFSRYSAICSEAYRTIAEELSHIIELEVAKQPKPKVQPLILEFSFHTDSENCSYGNLYYFIDNQPMRVQKMYTYINKQLEITVDSIARLPIIQPIQRYGINLITDEPMNATIRWNTFETIIVDTCTRKTNMYKPFVKTIDSVYFTAREYNPLAKEKIERTRKPTKLVYTFSTTEKQCNGMKYIDVAMTDFHTAGYGSWLPSLIIPGLGTYLQGKHSSVISRALPFFLFGSISAAGFIWENGKGKEIERPTPQEGNAKFLWEYKDFGYIVGWCGAAISATIYLTDIIEGISTGFRNMRITKNIRDRLKNGPILIQSDPINLETATVGK